MHWIKMAWSKPRFPRTRKASPGKLLKLYSGHELQTFSPRVGPLSRGAWKFVAIRPGPRHFSCGRAAAFRPQKPGVAFNFQAANEVVHLVFASIPPESLSFITRF